MAKFCYKFYVENDFDTDKAVLPINSMGMSKGMMEKVVLQDLE